MSIKDAKFIFVCLVLAAILFFRLVLLGQAQGQVSLWFESATVEPQGKVVIYTDSKDPLRCLQWTWGQEIGTTSVDYPLVYTMSQDFGEGAQVWFACESYPSDESLQWQSYVTVRSPTPPPAPASNANDVTISPSSGEPNTVVTLYNSSSYYDYYCYIYDTLGYLGELGYVYRQQYAYYTVGNNYSDGSQIRFDCTVSPDDPTFSDTFTVKVRTDSDGDGWYDDVENCDYDYSTTNYGCPEAPVVNPDTSNSNNSGSNNNTCSDGSAKDGIINDCIHDEDGDRVLDVNDDCVNTYGSSRNRGCPVEPAPSTGTADLLIEYNDFTLSSDRLTIQVKVTNMGSKAVAGGEIYADEGYLDWQVSRRNFGTLAPNAYRIYNFVLRLDERDKQEAQVFNFTVNVTDGSAESDYENNHYSFSYTPEEAVSEEIASEEGASDGNGTGSVTSPTLLGILNIFPQLPWFGICMTAIIIIAFLPRFFGGGNPPPKPWTPDPRKYRGPLPERKPNPYGTPKPKNYPPRRIIDPDTLSDAERREFQRTAVRHINQAQACQYGQWQCKLEDPELELQLYKFEKLTLHVEEQSRQKRSKDYEFSKDILERLNDAYGAYWLTEDERDLQAAVTVASQEIYQQISEWLKGQALVSNLELSTEIKGSGAKVNFQLYHCVGSKWEKFGKPWEAKVEDERDEEIIAFHGFHIRAANRYDHTRDLSANLNMLIHEL